MYTEYDNVAKHLINIFGLTNSNAVMRQCEQMASVNNPFGSSYFTIIFALKGFPTKFPEYDFKLHNDIERCGTFKILHRELKVVLTRDEYDQIMRDVLVKEYNESKEKSRKLAKQLGYDERCPVCNYESDTNV